MFAMTASVTLRPKNTLPGADASAHYVRMGDQIAPPRGECTPLDHTVHSGRPVLDAMRLRKMQTNMGTLQIAHPDLTCDLAQHGIVCVLLQVHQQALPQHSGIELEMVRFSHSRSPMCTFGAQHSGKCKRN